MEAGNPKARVVLFLFGIRVTASLPLHPQHSLGMASPPCVGFNPRKLTGSDNNITTERTVPRCSRTPETETRDGKRRIEGVEVADGGDPG